MKYNIMLTQEEDIINAFVLGLPICNVQSRTRNEAITLIRKSLTTVLKQSEIIQLEIPEKTDIPDKNKTWHDYGYGAFSHDSSWDELFDEIEANRNKQLL